MTTTKNTITNIFQNRSTMMCIVTLFSAFLLVSAVSIVSTVHASNSDTTKPTILYAERTNSTTLRITMSEAVYSENTSAELINAFDVILASSCHGQGGQEVNTTGVNGLATSKDSADNEFTVTFSGGSGICVDDLVYYNTRFATIKDTANPANTMPFYGNSERYGSKKKQIIAPLQRKPAPTATITGAPTGTSKDTALDVTVGGTDVTDYKYKLVESSSCGTGGYGSETAVATKITDSLTSYADGTLTLCVLGKNKNNPINKWQTSPTKKSWTKDSPEPSVTFNPANGGTLTRQSDDITITFDASVFADSSGTSFNSDSTDDSAYIGNIVKLKKNNASGTDITKTVAISGNVITINPTDAEIEDGRVYVGITNGWYYNQTDATTKVQGTAKYAILNVSIGVPSSPSVSMAPSEINKIIPTITVVIDSEQQNGTVQLFNNANCTGTPLSEAVTVSTSATVSVQTKRLVYNTAYTIYAKHTSSNNKSACSSSYDILSSRVVNYTPKDVTGPTILSATVSGNTVTFTLSEKAYAPNGLVYYNFESHPVLLDPLSVPLTDPDNGFTTNIPRTKSSAKSSFKVTFVNTPLIGAEYEYKKDHTEDGYDILDKDGNKMETQWNLTFTAGSVTNPPTPVAPTATISGAPTGTSSTTTLNVTVGGTNVTHYKYKLIQGSSCGTTGYGSETAVATKITDSLTSYTNGTMRLCVLGKNNANSSNQWQTSATSVSWTKNATQNPQSLQAPTIALQSPSTTPGNDSTPTFRVTVDNNYTSGSVRLFSDTGCSTSISSTASVSGTTVDVTVTTAFTHGQSKTVYAKHTVSGDSECSTTGATYRYNATMSAPAIALHSPNSTPGNDSTPTFRVTVDSNYTSGSVRLFSDSGCSTPISGVVAVSGTSVDVAANAFTHGQSKTVYAKHTAGGNSVCSTTGATYRYNATLVGPTIILKPGHGQTLTPTFTVTVDSNYQSGTVQLFENSTCSSPSHSNAKNFTGATVDITANTLIEGQSYIIYAKHTNGTQNKCSVTSVRYRHSTAQPSMNAPTLSLYSPSTSPNTDNTPTFRVTVDSNYTSGTVQLFTNSNCSDPNAISERKRVTSTTRNVTTQALVHGQPYIIYVQHADSNNSRCSATGVSYRYEVALTAPTIALKTGQTLTPTFTVTIRNSYHQDTVQLFSDNGCSTAISERATVDGTTADVTAHALTSGQLYTVYAKHTNSSGASVCSTTGVAHTPTSGGTNGQTQNPTNNRRRRSGGGGGGCRACGGGIALSPPSNAIPEYTSTKNNSATAAQIEGLEAEVIALMKRLVVLLNEKLVTLSQQTSAYSTTPSPASNPAPYQPSTPTPAIPTPTHQLAKTNRAWISTR